MMTGIAVGDLVQLLVDVSGRDVDGKQVVIARGVNVCVVEVSRATGKLEIESVVDEAVVTATVSMEEADLVWSEQLARYLEDMHL